MQKNQKENQNQNEKNKTVVITGGAKGIGKACAQLFAKKGWNTVICYNSSETEAMELEKNLKNICSFVAQKADVRNKEDMEKLMNFAAKKFGKIDALVCNAGIADVQKLFSDTKKEEWNRIFETDVYGVFNSVQAVLPFMINKKFGSIINISSVWGECGASCEAVYSAAKAAVLGFSKAMAKELAPSNIRVNAVSPGVINTEMNSNLSPADLDALKNEIPLGRIGCGEDVAKAVYFLASDNSSYITGQSIITDGGFIS